MRQFEASGKNVAKGKAVDLEDIKFHQCVRTLMACCVACPSLPCPNLLACASSSFALPRPYSFAREPPACCASVAFALLARPSS